MGGEMSGRSTLGLLLLVLACAPSGVPPSGDLGSGRELRGTVTYRVRMALPENAVVEVVLADVSRADAPMTVLAREEIRPGVRQVPIPFALRVDAATLAAGRRYQVRASIRADERLLFTSTTAVPVDPDAWPDRLEIVVEPVPWRGLLWRSRVVYIPLIPHRNSFV